MQKHGIYIIMQLSKINYRNVIIILLTNSFLLLTGISFAQGNASRIVKMQSSSALNKNNSSSPVISMEHAAKDTNKFGSINII